MAMIMSEGVTKVDGKKIDATVCKAGECGTLLELASVRGSECARIWSSTVIAVLLILAISCFMLGRRSKRSSQAVMPVTRDVASQSMVTYKRKWNVPQFKLLPEYSHG